MESIKNQTERSSVGEESLIAGIVRAYAQSPQILTEIFSIFLDEAPQRQEALTKAVQTGDLEAARSVAHSLANTTGTLKVGTALELSRATEAAARAGDRDALAQRSSELLDIVDRIVDAIRAHPLAPR